MEVNVVDRSCSTALENESRNVLISVPLKVRDHRNFAFQCSEHRSRTESDRYRRNVYVEF
jgi:hypothetical protein